MVSTSRRALFGAAAVLAASPMSLPAPSAEAAILQLEHHSRNAPPKGSADAVWDAWHDCQVAPLAAIEALPLTKENAVIRARAVMALHDFDVHDLMEVVGTTDQRLMQQIVSCLTEVN